MSNDTAVTADNEAATPCLHNGHTGSEWQQLNSQQRLYLLSDFCKFSLPYNDPGDQTVEWERTNGNTLYTVHPTRYIDGNGDKHSSWLYGKIGRLMLIWVSTQVMLRKADGDRTLTLPHSLNKLMLELGIERRQGKPAGTDYRRFRKAIQALCGMSTQITTYADNGMDGKTTTDNLIIADHAEIRWSSQTIGDTSTITLNKSTWDRMKDHSAPLDAAAVMLLTTTNPTTKGRSRGQDLDLYTWLSTRNYALTHAKGTWQTAPITWHQLANQFGNTYGRIGNFAYHFKKSLENVRMVWPDLKVEIIDGQGIILHQSKLSANPKHETIEG